MLLDTDVMVDYLRGHVPARIWLASYAQPIALPGLVAMELLQGCRILSTSGVWNGSFSDSLSTGPPLPIASAPITTSWHFI